MRSPSIVAIRFIVVLILMSAASGGTGGVGFKKSREKWIVNKVNKVDSNGFTTNSSHKDEGRGFLPPGGLFAFGKVLNFFPVGGERECRSSTRAATVARSGICLNPYDCRQRDGRAAGDCARGLGVCCVFEVTCGAVVQNNITYFMSPGFPDLWTGEKDCNITIEKIHAGITQLRIDFVNFNIGQPNRTTGECDEDVMVLGSDGNKFSLCGQNHGQHSDELQEKFNLKQLDWSVPFMGSVLRLPSMYYSMSTTSESREADELVGAGGARLSVRPRGGGAQSPRLWLMRLAQMPLAHSAPHDCLQYFTQTNGTITTFNYASNGRHLADQSYRACIRREAGQCGIRYTPCGDTSFRIGPGPSQASVIDPAVVEEEMLPVSETQPASNDEEGSGDVSLIESASADPSAPAAASGPQKTYMSMLWSVIWPSWLWGSQGAGAGAGRSWQRWSPWAQHYSGRRPNDDFRLYGYGNFGVGLGGYGRQRCTDRITILCDSEYFVSSNAFGPGVCDPHHCGNTFCPGRSPRECRVETSVAPFAVSVNFGPPVVKRSAEENIGACLRYTQLPCES